MYYEDQSRRFNLMSGLLFGTALGAGLALLLIPQDRVRVPGIPLVDHGGRRRRLARNVRRVRGAFRR